MTGLRRARIARGWSQARAAAEIGAVAADRGVAIPNRQHMKTQLSRWENGHHEPNLEYQSLWCAVYGLSRMDLGFRASPAESDDMANLVSRLALARTAGPETARMFHDQLMAIRSVDRKLGAPATHDRLLRLVASMRSLLAHALLPGAREPMARHSRTPAHSPVGKLSTLATSREPGSCRRRRRRPPSKRANLPRWPMPWPSRHASWLTLAASPMLWIWRAPPGTRTRSHPAHSRVLAPRHRG